MKKNMAFIMYGSFFIYIFVINVRNYFKQSRREKELWIVRAWMKKKIIIVIVTEKNTLMGANIDLSGSKLNTKFIVS